MPLIHTSLTWHGCPHANLMSSLGVKPCETPFEKSRLCPCIYGVVNCLFQIYFFIFPFVLGMIMYANEFKTKEKQKLTKVKN